ncbi:N-acetyltransferase [Arcanobacterium sp. S3PF19]|uniref:GNAT family N-acetyltransferase n=1 Tax=Arcanobacterium sp. S3PF19 TaxID=1219585 RepID=UPI00050E60B4|nr:GNAT family N-acetyltransferase [Arcanobacterium sp. S3PF19]KGF06332.1 hypothetical protein HMPREF1631_00725 [Arcanobacterium sp. S3PF19]
MIRPFFTSEALTRFYQFAVAPQITGTSRVHYRSSDTVMVSGRPEGKEETFLFVLGENRQELHRYLDEFRLRAKRPDTVLFDRRIYAALGEENREFFGPFWGWKWDFYWATEPLAPAPGTEKVQFLKAGSDPCRAALPEIRNLLETVIPTTDALRESESHDWFVYRQDNGEIAAVMGGQKRGCGIHFAGLGALPKFRGQGCATAVMTAAVSYSLHMPGIEGISFGAWNWNTKAQRLYRRLGIRCGDCLIHGGREPFAEANSGRR